MRFDLFRWLSWLMAPLCFAFAGLVTAYRVLFYPHPPLGEGYGVVPIYASTAAFLTACLCWWLLLKYHPRPRFWGGVITGVLITALAYPLTWYLAILVSWLTNQPAPGKAEVLSPLTGIPAALMYGLFSLVFTGWLTVPSGAIVGGVLALWECHQQREEVEDHSYQSTG